MILVNQTFGNGHVDQSAPGILDFKFVRVAQPPQIVADIRTHNSGSRRKKYVMHGVSTRTIQSSFFLFLRIVDTSDQDFPLAVYPGRALIGE